MVIYVKPLAHAVPLMWTTKLHTHINNRQHYGSIVFMLFVGKREDKTIDSGPIDSKHSEK